MKVAVFGTQSWDRTFLEAENASFGHDLVFFEPRLAEDTQSLATGFAAVSVFVNDRPVATVLEALAAGGTRLLALRSAGFNHVDLAAAARLGITVVRVPAYSPHSVAEHTLALLLTLDRKIHRAFSRVREGNFSLEGLLGFELQGRTVGIVGTGRIGTVVARILSGFGCRLRATDPFPNDECRALGVRYESLEDLLRESHIVTLHCPLVPETHHLIDEAALGRMQPGAMLINTGRGALVDTRAIVGALKAGRLGSLALDVYEEEADLFFRNLSDQVIQDDVFARLLTFPNVIITGHQGFFTRQALEGIARTTLSNIADFESGRPCPNRVSAERIRP